MDISSRKNILTYNVPYRLQSPFLTDMLGSDWKTGIRSQAKKINEADGLIYTFGEIRGLKTEIRINEDWAEYIRENYEIILGWIRYRLIIYLQRKNPSVPGISDKLSPPAERKLEKVKKYWKTVLELQPVTEIYAGIELTEKDISIDHFVPWSYVAHDEFWNLHPTTKSINSGKSNSLPDWDSYFKKFCEQEYRSYRLIWEYEKVRDEFEKCAKDHLNNEEIRQRIYRQGLTQPEFTQAMQSVLEPVYHSAQDCGFRTWIYTEKECG